MRAWLITGATSGLGLALARAALNAGDRVTVTGRNLERAKAVAAPWPASALPLALDVTEPSSVVTAVDAAERWGERIDVLVNSAGAGLLGAIEEADEDEIAALFDTNLFGALRLMRAVLPGMRARGRGHIVNIGSIAGRVGVAGSGLYAATKFALRGLSESLAEEVEPLGVRVTVVEPGAFRTDIAGRSRREMRSRLPAYDATAGRRREAVRAIDGRQPGDPSKAALAILEMLAAESAPRTLVLGPDAYRKAVDRAWSDLRELGEWSAVSTATDIKG